MAAGGCLRAGRWMMKGATDHPVPDRPARWPGPWRGRWGAAGCRCGHRGLPGEARAGGRPARALASRRSVTVPWMPARRKASAGESRGWLASSGGRCSSRSCQVSLGWPTYIITTPDRNHRKNSRHVPMPSQRWPSRIQRLMRERFIVVHGLVAGDGWRAGRRRRCRSAPLATPLAGSLLAAGASVLGGLVGLSTARGDS